LVTTLLVTTLLVTTPVPQKVTQPQALDEDLQKGRHEDPGH
jgi:hypothetical protein